MSSVLLLRRAANLAACSAALLLARAHDVGPAHGHDAPPAKPLPLAVEAKGPIKAPPRSPAGTPASGQGFWKFTAAQGVLPLPEEIKPFLKGAHGTFVVDKERDTVYWGLEKVGWVAFSERLTKSWVVKGDAAFASGNLHGADLITRKGKLPLVAVADNVKGSVYLSDVTFQHAEKLGVPTAPPYADGKGFAPTDVAFVEHDLFVTDGYGKAYFMPASIDPLAYRGPAYGGKEMSQTPHGITYDAHTKTLLVSARPEGLVKRWSPATHHWLEVAGLPPGSTVCDVDVWGDYALAPCLDGPNQSPGPIYVINLKKRTLVSTIRVKADLGFAEAQHIHDATWYLMPNGRKHDLYVIFTNWNPGGIGAVKLVSLPD